MKTSAYDAAKIQKWKQKAIDRGYEVKMLKKRIRELTLSRDNWKHKCHHMGSPLQQQSQPMEVP